MPTLATAPQSVRRGTLFRVEQSRRWEVVEGVRRRVAWLKLAIVEGGAGAIGCGCCYLDRQGQQHAYFVVWQGAHEPFMPVFFNQWDWVEKAARHRLRQAGLEAVMFVGDWAGRRDTGIRKVCWDLWAECVTAPKGTRAWRRRNGTAQVEARWKELEREFEIGNLKLEIEDSATHRGVKSGNTLPQSNEENGQEK